MTAVVADPIERSVRLSEPTVNGSARLPTSWLD
jgi:hypothetical protein